MRHSIAFALVFSAFTFISFSLHAQSGKTDPPNYKKIEKRIKKKKSPFHYDKLMSRYQSGDTTLTNEEFRHLYYGFQFQDAYAPYGGAIDFKSNLNAILRKDTLSDLDLTDIVRYSDSLLAANPFDISTMQYQMYALEELEQYVRFEKVRNQFIGVVRAIMSSGNGSSKEEAMYVIFINHEYAMLNILGFTFGGKQSLVDARYDYLEVEENDANLEGLYFDISASLNSLKGMFK